MISRLLLPQLLTSSPGRPGKSRAFPCRLPMSSKALPLEWLHQSVPKHLNPFSCQHGPGPAETGRVFRWRLLACPGQQQGEKGSLPSPPGLSLASGALSASGLSPKPAKTCLQRAPLESVSVLFTPKVFLETTSWQQPVPRNRSGRAERQAPLRGGVSSLCDTPCHTWGLMLLHALLPLASQSGRPGGLEGYPHLLS